MKHGRDIAKTGSMVLVEVKRIYKRDAGMLWFDVRLNDGWGLCFSPLHCFLATRNGGEVPIRGEDVVKGDRIWIDKSAFLADGSLVKIPVKKK